MKLAFDVQGRGPNPLLLLHGFTGSRDSFVHLEPALVDAFTLIRVDLPGHGASADEAGTFLEVVDALAGVLDEAGVPDADVYGYSQGARVALTFAVQHPTRVRRLVLESGTPGLRHRRERLARRASDHALADRILRDGVEAFVTEWEQLPLFEGLRRLPPAQQAALRARRTAHTAEGLARALRTLGLGEQPDLWPRLWNLRRPVLLLTGALDLKFTELARRMAAELPTVWGHAFAGVGHAPHLECPGAWLAEVTGFLQTPWFEFPAVSGQPGSDA
ncbi:MAG: 2-succinyl-6-hydroxy-2,4-cyclohexadiene-1-carboxylate synthase [Myxococcaceae bacterium]|nr:2-succinyl-6-hydroxy-2,4-cyclohexadiene-1-carboxylate synthase [Myxococcaceae bacterium]